MSTQVALQERNAAAPQERRATAVEAYTAQVMGDETASAELFRALPDHIKPERFRRNLINALMQKPEMLNYDPRLVYREVSKVAALGLLLDPQLGEAYIVGAWNAKKNREEPQLRVGYRGLIKLARQSGEVANVYAHEVHEHDFIECELGAEKRLVHKPNLFSDRGKVVGYYAVVKFKDGETDFEPMTVDQVHAIRDKSDAWRAFKAGKIKSTPWSTDEGEMSKKTAIKRLLKRVPQSPELTTALSFDNEREIGAVIDVPQPARADLASLPPAPRSITARLDAFAEAETVQHDEPEHAPSAPAVPDLPGGADEPEAAPSAHVAVSGDPAQTQDKIAAAMDMGRAACRAGHDRAVPRKLQYKSMEDQQTAFLQGWDDENARISAAETGEPE